MKKLTSVGSPPLCRFGFVLSALVVIGLLGACQSPVAENTGDGDLVTVSVKLPQNNSRAILTGQAAVWIDYYQVTFNELDGSNAPTTNYYTGAVEDGKGVISVALPGNKKYNVLLLAGTKKERVLLASAFIKQQPITKNTTISFGGTGAAIDTGLIKTLVIDNANNIGFTDIAGGNWTGASNLLTGLPDDNTGYTAGLTVGLTIKSGHFDPLIRAENKDLATSDTVPTFTKNKVYLKSISTTGTFNKAADADTPTRASGADGDVEYSYIFDKDDFTTIGNDTLKLYFEMEYYPFGTSASGASKWYIRNGLNRDMNVGNAGMGSAIMVETGTGGDVPVNYDGLADLDINLP